MDISELKDFKLSDAVVFHDDLNPNLWNGTRLDPKVKQQLMLIAEDFITTLGISDLHIKDITISGSNAAYSYTPHSDLDLHILVDMDKLPNNEVYRELFTAKKTLYNDQHNVSIRNVPVEVYVQDTNEPVKSLGEYSVVNDKWIKIPKKQRANFDQAATKAKYESLAELVDLAIKSADLDRVKKLIDMIRRYRKAGLSKGGEFSPENLAYKAVRSQGAIDALYDLRDTLHGDELSIEEASSREDAIIKINKLKNTSGRTENEIATINAIIERMMKQYNIKPKEIGMSQGISSNNYPRREPVDPLKARMAKAEYEKQQAAAELKREWERFKSGFFKKNTKLDEAYTTKQQVIDHFVRMARKRGENIDLAMRKGAGAWERGWRGGEPKKPKEPNKPKEIKPYDPELYKNVRARLPYKDDDDETNEDYNPNGPPPGPEFKPTMPAGTVKVDVSDVYDWYKLGQHISNMKGLGKHDFGQGPPSTILSFGDEDTEHKYIQDLEKTGLTTTDIDPVDPSQPKGMKRQKTDPTYNVNEDADKKAAVLKIQKHLNKKYGANLDLDGVLGPLTLKSINKFMPRAKTGLADEPNKTTAVQGKKLKETESKPATTINFRTWQRGGVPRHSFVVVRDGKEIAGGEILKDNEWDDDRSASVQDIVVHPDYRRKGFATKIYNEIERKFNYKLHPSDDVKPDGQEFWKARSNLDESSMNRKHGLLKSTVSFNAIYMCEGMHYSKDMLLEQVLYENFLSSATQFLGQKANQTIANVKGQINDTINAGIVIKDIVSNPQLLSNTTSQIRKWISQLIKNITAKMQQVGQKLNAPQLTEKLIAAWKFISSKVTEFGSSDGWKGFLGSLGIYGFVKFIGEMMQNLTTLKSTIVGGALDALLDKAKELGTSVLGNITMPGFLAIFDKLTTVKKYFLDVLTQVKDKFGSINVPGTAQFSKGVQLEASGYIPSAKEKNDPRFKTALTVDVKPDAIKKNAKAFGFKTSRAGIPPQARADGKIK